MFDRRGRAPGKGPDMPGHGGGIGIPGKQTLVQQLEQVAPRMATSSAGVATAAPAQTTAEDTPKAYVRHQVPITKELTADEFKEVAMRQIFGGVIEGVQWKHIKESYGPADSPAAVEVDVALLRHNRGVVNQARGFEMDPAGGIAGAADRAQAFQESPASDERAALMAEIDRRYHEASSGAPEGAEIKPGEHGRAALWRAIRDEVLFQHQYIANLPPAVKELIRFSIKDKELAPADYDQLFRVAKKIENMRAGQAGDYLSKVAGSATDLTAFEAALDSYAGEQAKRSKQGEDRAAVQTKLLGLEEIYKQVRDYKNQQNIDMALGAMGGLAPPASWAMQDELERQLPRYGFASLAEFGAYIGKFERAFEDEAANIVLDLLAKYAGKLYREAERYKDPQEVSALYQKLSGFRTHHAEFAKNAAISNSFNPADAQAPRVPGQGHVRPKVTQEEAQQAHARAAAAKEAAKAEIEGLAASHPIFQEEGLPLDKRIDKNALGQASEAQLGGLIQTHVAGRVSDLTEARTEIEGKHALIYKMDKLMPQFYARQGIAPGSIGDLIIQDKMRDDAITKIVVGVAIAVVSIALTVISFGAATPAIVAAGAGLAGAGLSGYVAYEEYQQYVQTNHLADAGLTEHESPVWLVLAVVGAGVDMAAAVKAVRALGPAAKSLDAANDATDFTKAVEALQQAGELDAKIAHAAEKAAAARKGFAEAKSDLRALVRGRTYTVPGPFADPEVYRQLVKMAVAKIKEGFHSAQAFIDELKKARVLEKLGDMSPEELTKAKEAWEHALRLAKSADEPIEIVSESGKVIGEFSNGSHLKIISKDVDLHGGNTIRLDPDATTTVTGGLDDVNAVARRGERLPGATQMGDNPGGINILRSPKWDEIKIKHKAILDAGDAQRYWKTVTDEFWEVANKPWLDEAIARGDKLRFISNPEDAKALYVTNRKKEFILDENGNQIKSIFGREVDYLKSKGYKFMPDGTAVKAE